jgi:3-(3-hydroxy-phenyl)propionate hydroxylase
MVSTYTNPEYPFIHSPDQDSTVAVHHPVVIVGGGPSGLSAAMDLALQGIRTVVLDDNNTVSYGSRAICFAKRTLEIMDRYGCGDRMVEKGVTWKIGKVFFRDDLTYEFNLLPEEGHKMPAFINLQQYYFEEYMVERCAAFDEIDLRWLNKAKDIRLDNGTVSLNVETPEGDYPLTCDYLLVADGANSPIRESLGLESEGQIFHDKFLIADIVMKATDFPSERWFWFDPPFHPGQSVLLHKQPDNVWRIDFQLGWEADSEEAKKPENVIPRIRTMLGDDVEFEPEWLSVYTFRCRRMKEFIHADRVIFIGDSAHQVSPFGARGANGGCQSVENLCWKLKRIMTGEAPPALLHTYNSERSFGADENILNSTRATDFITPKNDVSRVFRDETLRLARKYPFARTLINSGRLSQPCTLDGSPLNTPDEDDFDPEMRPGSVCRDAPITIEGEPGWLLNHIGNRFSLLLTHGPETDLMLEKLKDHHDLQLITVSFDHDGPLPSTKVEDTAGLIGESYQLQDGTCYLIRPDQHVCARWRKPDGTKVLTAIDRALGKSLDGTESR